MNGTLVGNLQESPPLCVGETARERHLAVDAIEQSVGRVTALAICGMNLRMPQADRDSVERPLLSLGVHRHRDRHAGPQRREKKPVRIGSRISPSRGGWLVA